MDAPFGSWHGLMCCICFRGLTPEECFQDSDGQKWDMCAVGTCAQEAGYIDGVYRPTDHGDSNA